MQGQMQDQTGPIWVLGILLVIAAAATSPYWHSVAYAVSFGQVPGGAGKPGNPLAPGSGLLLTLGTLVLVLVLVGMAQVSTALGNLAIVLLVALWILFLLGHTGGVTQFFARLSPQAGQQG